MFSGKTLDQVTDMMIANSQNLIVTVKPTAQPKQIQRLVRPYVSVQLRIKGGANQQSGTDEIGQHPNIPVCVRCLLANPSSVTVSGTSMEGASIQTADVSARTYYHSARQKVDMFIVI